MPALKDWKVDRNFNGSDHNTLTFFLENNTVTESIYHNYKKADWEMFTELLERSKFYYPARINRKKIGNMISCLNKRINAALDVACPLRKKKFRKRNLHWFGACLLYTSPSPRD